MCPISIFPLIFVSLFPLSSWNDYDVKMISVTPRRHTWNVCPLSLFPLKYVPPFPISLEMCAHFPYFSCRWSSLTSGIVERFHRLQLNVTCLVPCPYVSTFSKDQFSLCILFINIFLTALSTFLKQIFIKLNFPLIWQNIETLFDTT